MSNHMQVLKLTSLELDKVYFLIKISVTFKTINYHLIVLYVCINQSINQSIQFWSGFIPINGGGQIYPTLTAISPTPTLHLTWFKAASFFSKPTLLLSFSTYIFHVFFGHSHFLLPFTSNSQRFSLCIYYIIKVQFRMNCLVFSIEILKSTNT